MTFSATLEVGGPRHELDVLGVIQGDHGITAHMRLRDAALFEKP